MENTKIIDEAIRNCRVPKSWLMCFNGSCKRCMECLRYRAYRVVGREWTCGNAVFPAAAEQVEGCGFFEPVRLAKMAWGFNGLLGVVRANDAPRLRALMKGMLGGNTAYYHYHHGRKLLTPEQQVEIRELFGRFGYDGGEFDGYSEGVVALPEMHDYMD